MLRLWGGAGTRGEKWREELERDRRIEFTLSVVFNAS